MDELNLKRDKSYHVVMEVCGRVACLRIAGRIHYPSIDSGCHCVIKTIMPWMGNGWHGVMV